MSISVIIPAYKARRFLSECLESIGQQTLAPEEVLVIDDCSPEPIDDIVEGFKTRSNYPPLKLLKHDVNRGQAAARNTGIKVATGEWLAFIDCDDIWAPRHLESVHAVANQQDADLIYCPAILFDQNPYDPNNYCLAPISTDEKKMRPRALLDRCFIITSSIFLKKNSLIQIGGFDESPEMRGVEDLDCFMRLLRTGAKFAMSDKSTLYYRKHADSATGTLGYLARQDIAVKKKHIEWVEGPLKEKRRIMIESYWRAAIQLWRAQAPDRMVWFLAAFRYSLCNPCKLAKNLFIWLKQISCNHLHESK